MKNLISQKIVNFLNLQTCVNICTVNENNLPYCFTCYFVFDEEKKCLYYKSNINTKHSELILKNNACAGTILEDQLNKMFLKGIQFQGSINKTSNKNLSAFKKYHKKYPMALAIPGEIWVVNLEIIKFTDNSMGFGHKTHWSAL
ncbi:pyridoxamine 5'-phosphate oxidase family protein [Cloacibacterium sp.]|uniref:pyridoxamine 5'-phosphate oxidase family protein n=1 Tax=Cloacibacterium sp. TaxID=1913682 RepID=UPI0039E53D8B